MGFHNVNNVSRTGPVQIWHIIFTTGVCASRVTGHFRELHPGVVEKLQLQHGDDDEGDDLDQALKEGTKIKLIKPL
jgi:hypothetical protein